jgi:hypothetical protein
MWLSGLGTLSAGRIKAALTIPHKTLPDGVAGAIELAAAKPALGA